MVWKSIILVNLLLTTLTTYGQELLGTAYTDKYEISIYGRTSTSTHSQARQACIDLKSRLIKVDSADITNAIKSKLRYDWEYWIGATDTSQEEHWKWLDGSNLNDGYRNWESSEPNNAGGNEDCAVVRNGKWNDVKCDVKFAFICQKDRDYCETHSNTCSNEGICTSALKSPFFLCQCMDGYYGNTCSDQYCETHTNTCSNGGACISTLTSPFFSCRCTEGYYGYRCRKQYCAAHKNTCKNRGTCTSTTTSPFFSCRCMDGYYGNTCSSVPSRPTTLDIIAQTCNTSLVVSWSPNKRASRIQHRIVISSSNGNTVMEIYSTPETDHPSLLRYWTKNLSSWTEYNVSITPCPTTGKCKTEYSFSKTVRTAGIPGKVKDVVTETVSPTSCEMTWLSPENVTINGYQINITEVVADEDNGQKESATLKQISGYSTSYKFEGKPNRRYSFGIQAKTCAGTGPVVWSGQSCKTSQQVSVFVYVGVAVALVVLVVVCCVAGVLIYRRRRHSDTPVEQEQDNTYEYPTIPMGLIEEAGYDNDGLYMPVGSDAHGQVQCGGEEHIYDN